MHAPAAAGRPPPATRGPESRPSPHSGRRPPGRPAALWATVFFVGLRIGEAYALRCAKRRFRRRRKSNPAGMRLRASRTQDRRWTRAVPLLGELRTPGSAQTRDRTWRSRSVLRRELNIPFVRSAVRAHARAAWKQAGLQPVTPHAARHTCASYLIAAGIGDMELQACSGTPTCGPPRTCTGTCCPRGWKRRRTRRRLPT